MFRLSVIMDMQLFRDIPKLVSDILSMFCCMHFTVTVQSHDGLCHITLELQFSNIGNLLSYLHIKDKPKKLVFIGRLTVMNYEDMSRLHYFLSTFLLQ